MSLVLGDQLGPYEILSPIGNGGMGQVFRARDSRLGRDVAIKVSAARFSERFEREARAIAVLNHPNICTLYDVGPDYLVMEFIEGETLKGPLPLDVVLNYARQIADAVEAAHERGIVHRDLKPDNIKIKPAEGGGPAIVKVLDFGLATIAQDAPAAAGGATLTMSPSGAGGIAGTAAYMAPEQARGKSVDRRADVWAFGAVLFEMVTGRQLFTGETITDILASVVKDEPDLSELPSRIRTVVERCLSKDPRHRWGSIGDVRWALDALAEVPDSPARSRVARYLPWAAAAAFALAGITAWLWKPSPGQPLLQMEITAPEGVKLGSPDWGQFELSPDGHRLAFIAAGADGKSRIWLRSLDQATALPLAGTEGAFKFPSWSPDSRWLAFFANGKLEKINVSAGAAPQRICGDCGAGYLSWSTDGTILFNLFDNPIQRVPASGGNPAPVFGFDSSQGEIRQIAPYFLPGGKQFLYMRFGKENGVVLASLDGKTRRLLIPGETTVSYVPNPAGGGWLLYLLQRQLFARPFNPRKGEFTGEAALVASSLPAGPSWSTSGNGLLAFRRTHESESELTWFDRTGARLSTLAGSGELSHPRISPDGRTVVFVRREQANGGIWLFDTVRQVQVRLTSEPGPVGYPTWSLDSNHVFYSSIRRNDHVLIERAANGTDEETILLKSQAAAMQPTAVFNGGRWLVATETTAGVYILWLLSRLDNAKSIRLNGGRDGTVSPDGRWLLYETGGLRPEVFVRSVPAEAGGLTGAAGEWKISTADGGNPVWGSDGKEIFYLAGDGKMMAVPVESGETALRPGTPQVLFQTPLRPGLFRDYDVTRDGKRFLLNAAKPGAGDEPITIIVNWPKLLQK